jgi:cation diffusion facilitator CzcD-associated flavoprotein CzcO
MTTKIAIIGGGAAGLASLKVLLETPEYKSGLWQLVLYEAREDVGGIW